LFIGIYGKTQFQINTGNDGISVNSELFSTWEERVGVCFWQFLRICFDDLKREGKKVGLRTIRLLSFDATGIAQKTAPPTILRCRGNVFTELLPSNDRGIHSP
jgi:hypothetical protein